MKLMRRPPHGSQELLAVAPEQSQAFLRVLSVPLPSREGRERWPTVLARPIIQHAKRQLQVLLALLLL